MTESPVAPRASVIVDVFVSVDGWAGSAVSPGYFGYFGPELEQWITNELARPQLALYGRRTYQALADLPEPVRDESWRMTARTPKVVFSRTITTASPDWPNTRICSADAVEEVGRLAATSDVALRTIGSLSVARQLLSAGLVNRLRLMTFPLLVGDAGREPFFAGVASGELELLDHRTLDGRILLLEYRPTGRDIPVRE